MPATDDLVTVAARLEAALERIASCQAAGKPAATSPDLAADADAQEVAARLDALIDQLRSALSSATV